MKIRLHLLYALYSLYIYIAQYLAELLIPYQQTSSLSSANLHLLTVPKIWLKTYGDRCFTAEAAYKSKLFSHCDKNSQLSSHFYISSKETSLKQCYKYLCFLYLNAGLWFYINSYIQNYILISCYLLCKVYWDAWKLDSE